MNFPIYFLTPGKRWLAGSLAAFIFVSPAEAQTARKTHTVNVITPANQQIASSDIERRVEALLKKMTLDEKLGQLVQYNDAGVAAATAENAMDVPNPQANYKLDAMQLAEQGKLGSMLNTVGAERTTAFQKAAVEKSRLHIPILFGADILHGYRTFYPVPIGLAASWNPDLVSQVSRISASEAVTAGVRWFYSPMVDISRDARWGRTVEGAGEDPYLGSAIARAYIDGYQNHDLSRPDSVAASVKHFAAYGAAEAGREYNTTDMSLSRLHQVYLPPYQAAVEAGAATIMSAFNSLNGLPATANPYLLQTVLRDRWGFNGFVVSDYTAVMELTHHGIALDPATATEKALNAGVDVDMMSHYYDTQLPGLIQSGKVTMAVVDESVRRVLRIKFALGLFENPYPQGTEIQAAVPEHRPIVREAAEQSFVLLQNKNTSGRPLLPLSERYKTIALIGPLAERSNVVENGGPVAGDLQLKEALEARARQVGARVLYTQGTGIQSMEDSGFPAAVNIAKQADVVVMAMGESINMSGEAESRAHLSLPGNQEDLLKTVTAVGKPVVLLVFSGRPLVLDWADKNVATILECWFPGSEGGNALARTLYGDVSPSGKLPMSFPRSVGQEPLYYSQLPTGRPPNGVNLNMPPDGSSRFISRYIDVPNDALFPFGHGLSYTTFAYSDVALSRTAVPLREVNAANKKPVITVRATVTNNGDRPGTEVVQCYVRLTGASLSQPVRSLKGFQRVTLKPGESAQVLFKLGYDELSFFNNEGHSTIEATQNTVWIGGSSLASHGADFKIVQ